jgi:hypothetical protein
MRAEQAQKPVAGIVPERVVDELELVDVKKQHRVALATAGAAGQRVTQAIGQ